MKTISKVVFINMICLFILCAFMRQSHCENLELSDNFASIHQTVVFELKLNDAPNIVSSMGIDISYDTTILSFQSYEKGELATGRFDFFDVNEPEKGTIRIGGTISSSTNKIQVGESGTLVKLSFTVISTNTTSLQLINLKDNVRDWSIKNGFLGEKISQYEDIDNDGKVGLAEVIYLLQVVTGF